MLKSKIYLMLVLMLIGVFIVSTSAGDERADQNFKIDKAFVKDKTHPKIESNLLKEKSGAFAAQNQNQNTIQIVLELKGSDESYIKSLEDRGAVIEAVHKNLVQASVPASQLEAMAGMPFVDYVRSPLRPYKDVVSEGIGVINANQLHSLGFNGSGVKIAVIDLGFAGYLSKLGTELPLNVTIRSFRNDTDITGGGETHGTAVAEIVYDVASGAKLYLINFDTDVEFANAVDYAISQDVDVISMSVGWLPGPFDGTGFIDDIVNNATAKGIVWVNSAGNYAQKHWGGKYSEKTIPVDSDTWFVHNFGNGDETNSFDANAGDTIVAILSWNDWPKSDQDYDLFLVNEDTMTIVWGSENTQNGTQEPWEAFSYNVTSSGRYGILFRKFSATKPVDFELYFMSKHRPEYKVEASSLALPADAKDVITVGAVYWSDDSLESFSSQGPTKDGRTKPDVVAPDGVSTSTYGAQNFFGTSASAPHAAGAAALLYQANHNLSALQLKQALEGGARDLGVPGKDNKSGAGRIDVYASYLQIKGTTYSFDTGAGTYPSISGVHNGTITLNQTLTVHRIYTYPSPGTGGHSEYAAFYYLNGTLLANGTWSGYQGDWHNITFAPFTLEANVPYNYTIRTGSYPQIIHSSSLSNSMGTMTSTDFIDANGRRYTDWIPAIRLE